MVSEQDDLRSVVYIAKRKYAVKLILFIIFLILDSTINGVYQCSLFICSLDRWFQALSNGRCKSCLHRAIVNRFLERRSLVFFVCPREDKVVRPPPELGIGPSRKFPDFTWSDLLDFTQNHYRADVSTLDCFFHWLTSSKPSNIA